MIQGVVELFQRKYFKNDAGKMTHFFENWERSKVAKASLFEMLGGEEHSFSTAVTPDNVADMYPTAFGIIRDMAYTVDNTCVLTNEQIFTNRTASGRKVSRFILGNRDKIQASGRKFLPNRNLYGELKYEGYGLDSFIKTVYEKIAATKSEEIVISANYVDILSAGHVSGENSCYCQSIFRSEVTSHGQYSLAPHIFAEDKNTLIAYVLSDDKTKFNKRVWIHVNEERDRFIIGRLYGNWGQHSLINLYRKMEQLCGDSDASNWVFRSNVSSYLSRGSDRVEYNHSQDNMFYTGDTAVYCFKKRNATTNRLKMVVPTKINCIRCGEEHDHVDGSGMCWDCTDQVAFGSRCQICNNRGRDLIEFNGILFCEECAPRVEGYATECPECHQMYTEIGVRDRVDSRYLCPHCYEVVTERRRIEREAFEAELRRIRERQAADRESRSVRFREALRAVYDMPMEFTSTVEVPEYREFSRGLGTATPDIATIAGVAVNIAMRDLDTFDLAQLRAV